MGNPKVDPLITLTVNSTHFYLTGCTGGWLLVDAGWDLASFTRQLKAKRIAPGDIRYVMFTHHHPDHAGLAGEILELSGGRLIIHEVQIPYLDDLHAFLKKKGPFTPLRVDKTTLVSPDRAALERIGVAGEIVETPGHSPDHISLVLDSRIAFTGDLPPPEYTAQEAYREVCQSWKKLLERGVEWVYPSHTARAPVAAIRGECLGGSG
jgi:glyoxylase-like metal-dependent hydrolase (beta-lactamase superfamily II)